MRFNTSLRSSVKMATRWACLGPGKISTDFFKAMRLCLPAKDHELVAVASRDLARAQTFAEEFNFKRAYGSYDEASDGDVEVVYIGTLHVSHVDLSIQMLEAGKHVLCEKPMAINVRQAKMVFDAARKNGKTFVEAIWMNWFPVYAQVRKELAAGTLGDVNLVVARFCQQNLHVERIRTASMGGGGLLDAGIYMVNLACLVYKEMPESIKAVGQLSEAKDVDLGGCIILKYESGAMASLTYHTNAGAGNNSATTLTSEPYQRVSQLENSAKGEYSATIMGNNGCIEIPSPFHCSTKCTTPSGNYEFSLVPGGDYFHINSAGLAYEASAMRETILSGKLEDDLCSHAHSEMVLSIMDEVRRQIGLRYPDFDD